jgi:hypothetical protein
MKKPIKIIALLLAALFLIAGTVMVASATGEPVDGEGGGDYVDPGSGEDPGTVEEPADPGSGEDPVDPGSGEEPVDPGSGEEPADPDPGYVDPGYDDSGSGSGNDTGYVEPDYEEDPLWYGDNSDRDYNTGSNDRAAGSVSDITTLYNTSGISDSEVAPNKWTNIALDEKTVSTGSGSFSAIKTNTAQNDNGQWILYIGYLLIALSILGILYFIVATISARKENERERRHNGHNDAAAPADEPKTEAKTTRCTTGHYADGYESYSSRRSSRADTGEIYVPRRVK